MNLKKIAVSILLLGFAALNFAGLFYGGYAGLFEYVTHMSIFGWILLVDLLIALGMVLIWLWKDARAQGRNPWPYTILTILLGSIGTLLYVLLSKDQKPQNTDP